MHLEIKHTTSYKYKTSASYSIQCLRLTPPSFDGQKVVSWRISAPGFEKASSYRDGFGNLVHVVTLTQDHDSVSVEAKGVVETQDKSGIIQGLPDAFPLRNFLRFTESTTPDSTIRDLALHSEANDTLNTLHHLMVNLNKALKYEIGATEVHTNAAEALSMGKGVCQDYAHIFVAAARILDIPARYVNGYFLISEAQDPSYAHHGWAEAWVEGLGWVGFDATNLTCPTDRYVRLATGLDAQSAAPIRGTRRGGEKEALDVTVEVQQQKGQQ
ncbi:MAG: transglutaminase N-terminal domain-containing protein [Hyphomicrobium sp.]